MPKPVVVKQEPEEEPENELNGSENDPPLAEEEESGSGEAEANESQENNEEEQVDVVMHAKREEEEQPEEATTEQEAQQNEEEAQQTEEAQQNEDSQQNEDAQPDDAQPDEAQEESAVGSKIEGNSVAMEIGEEKKLIHSLPSEPLVMTPRMRAAHEHVVKNEYDVDAWATYLAEIQVKPIAQCREFFERFFKVFPTASRQWRYWIDQELQLRNFELAESLLKRCLLTNLDIDLWKLYLRYIKQIKKGCDDEDKVVEEAFEFVVKHMGYDLGAAPVWRAYVNVLKAVLTKSHGEFEEGEIIRKIRSVYQRACVLPISNGDVLWREYDTWEHSLNKNLATSLLAENQPKHVNARIYSRKRKEMREGIVTTLLAVPPQEEKIPQSRFRIKHFNQLLLWKKYIAFEQSNLMNLDPVQLKKRVVFSFRQALLTLRHFPEVWHDYAMYLHNNGSTDEAVKVFHEACEAMPYNILIHFIFADYQEERKLFKEARSIYNALLYGTPILKESSHKEEEDDLFGLTTPKVEESRTNDMEEKELVPILTSEKDKSLVYCHLMRFAQRCEGKEAARKVLFQARKHCTLHHPFIEAARIEQHLNNEPKIASKIFSFGLQDFLTTPDYVTAYLDFLMEISDHTNCRVIFERVFAAAATAEKENSNYEASSGAPAPKKPEDIATPAIWARFVHFERMTGDISAIVKAEKRRAEKLPSVRFHPFQELIDRHTLLDLLPCSQAYCDSIATGGVMEESSQKQFDGNRASRVLTPAESKKIKRRYPRPAIGKMLVYKLGMEVKGATGVRRLYADRPAPEALSNLIGMLPSKDMGGPRIDSAKLIACISKISLPSPLGPHPGGDPKSGPSISSQVPGVKRKDLDEDEDSLLDADGAPTHDPYRKRSLARRREQNKSKNQRTS